MALSFVRNRSVFFRLEPREEDPCRLNHREKIEFGMLVMLGKENCGFIATEEKDNEIEFESIKPDQTLKRLE
jgi:hypothetical protein